jgi:hypothetical protein
MIYDAVISLATHLADAELDTVQARKSAIGAGEMQGLNGTIRIGADRDLVFTLQVKTVTNGRGVPVPVN